MALENIAELEQTLGIESGKLQEMITGEEVHKLDLSTKVILDKTTYDERISNIKKDSSSMALEIAIKEQRNTLGLDFQGKTMENLVNAIKEKTEKESKIAPEEKYNTLKSDFEKLQDNFTKKETEFSTFKTNIEKQSELTEIKSEFTKHISGETFVSGSTIFAEAKDKGYSFEKEEGKTVVKLNGETQKNKETLSPITVKDFVTDFQNPYLKTPTGGSGGTDDTPPSKAGSLEAFEKEAEKNGWNATKQNEEMSKRIKDGTLKI
jgi:hypothetical protein